MKRTLLLSVLLSFAGAAIAQPVVTSAVNPQNGDNHTFYYAAFQSPGSSGANASWNFSSLSATSSTLMTYSNCSGSSACGSFPLANMHGSGGGADAFLALSSSAYAFAGVSQGGVNIVYSNPEDYMHYPLTYHNTFSDAFAATFTSGYTFYRSGTTSDTADAYGTLVMPSGTFHNVLRVHRVEHYQDSVPALGGVMYNYYNDMYTWYSPYVREVLLSITNLSVNGASYLANTTYTDIVPTGISGVSNLEYTFDAYPNPAAGGSFTVKFNLQHAEQVHISLVDMMGRNVRELVSGTYGAGEQKVSVTADGLAAGLYMLHLQADEASVTRKIEIQ